MLTGSMAPEIEPGDVTVVTPISMSEVTEGMVITYHRPIEDHSLVTHRVISVQTGADGTVTVQTKGDANDAVDPWTATLQGDTAYRVRAVIPELGHLIQALRTPVLSQALLYGAPALLVGWVLLTIWRPADEDAAEDTVEDAQAPAAKDEPKAAPAVEEKPAVEKKPAPKPATAAKKTPAKATKPAAKTTTRPAAKPAATKATKPAAKTTTRPAAKPAATKATKPAAKKTEQEAKA
jgi:signal peptidase I